MCEAAYYNTNYMNLKRFGKHGKYFIPATSCHLCPAYS